jgi:2-deoxy-D-gluconate 3-dehydrogenase
MPVAIVTGASTGIGRATALDLARHGYDVALCDLPGVSVAEVAGHADAAGRRMLPVDLDLREEASISACIATVAEAFGAMDVLINNAATTLRRMATEVTWAEWDGLMSVNLKGHYFMSTAYGRWCIANGKAGSIVSTASTHGLTGLPMQSVYGIAKGGIIQMTRMLAVEWARQGIRVNAVAPATVLTPSRHASLTAEPERLEMMLNRLPQGRFPTAEDIAAAIRYLAGPEAAAVTGHILPVDGGLMAV